MSIQNSRKPANPPISPGTEAEIDPLAKWIPYVKPLLIGVGVVLLGILGYGLWNSRRESRVSTQWDEFNRAFYESLGSGSPDGLTDVSERFANTRAGVTASQVAGDMYAERGLGQWLTDREAAKKDLERARDRYRAIIDSNLPKDDLLFQQAKYSLAYVTETLADPAMANELYRELIQNHPESPFRDLAERGQMRCNLAKEADFFAEFDAYNFDVVGPAPGEALPDVPDIRLTQPGDAGPAEGAPDGSPSPTDDQPLNLEQPSNPEPTPPAGGGQ